MKFKVNYRWLAVGLVTSVSVAAAVYLYPNGSKGGQHVVNHYKKRTIRAKITAYCPCKVCCGRYADGLTSTKKDAWAVRGIAADPHRIAYGSTVVIPNVGSFVVDDCSTRSRSETTHLQLRFHSHQEARDWGVQYHNVEVTYD